MKPLDVLLISPLSEELDALRKWCHDAELGPLGVEWCHYRDLSIGLYCIGRAGSANAAMKCSPVINAYRPKAVLLIGIAAGKERTNNGEYIYRAGYVGYNETIYYPSFGKLEKGKMSPRGGPISKDPWLFECATEAKNSTVTTLKGTARKWFDMDRRNCAQWGKGSSHGIQHWPEYPFKAKPGDVGSGELLIRDEGWQKDILKWYPSAGITLYEMESYAIASVCDDCGKIPFAMIRGISDNATSLKNDKCRLCATLVASAFAKAVLDSERFQKAIEDKQRIRSSLSLCLMSPSVSNPCPNMKRASPSCSSIPETLFIPGLKQSWLSRVYERIKPIAYSKGLKEYLKTLSKNDWNGTITFVFPYTPRDLLFLMRNLPDMPHAKDKAKGKDEGKPSEEVFDKLEADRKKRQELLSLDMNKVNSDMLAKVNGRIAKSIREIAQYAKKHFPHFAEADRLSKSLRTRVAGKKNTKVLPGRIARIIVLKKTASERELIEDPSFLIYPELLGRNVETYYAFSDDIQRYDVNIDDVTCLETMSHGNGNKGESAKLLVMRFYMTSNVLLVTGRPCSASGMSDAEIKSEMNHLIELKNMLPKGGSVKRHEEDEGEPSLVRFPAKRICDQHAID